MGNKGAVNSPIATLVPVRHRVATATNLHWQAEYETCQSGYERHGLLAGIWELGGLDMMWSVSKMEVRDLGFGVKLHSNGICAWPKKRGSCM